MIAGAMARHARQRRQHMDGRGVVRQELVFGGGYEMRTTLGGSEDDTLRYCSLGWAPGSGVPSQTGISLTLAAWRKRG
jgi:hypothetical protein